MSETARTIIALSGLAVYAGLILLKAVRIRQSVQSRDARILRFEMLRLGLDCLLFVSFFLTGLCPAWFDLFSPTPLGICTGYIALICFTLLASVAVDWFWGFQGSEDRRPSFAAFLCHQLRSILRITCAMVLVWIVFLGFEKSEVRIWIRIAAAALALFIYSLVPRLIRKYKRKIQESEE